MFYAKYFNAIKKIFIHFAFCINIYSFAHAQSIAINTMIYDDKKTTLLSFYKEIINYDLHHEAKNYKYIKVGGECHVFNKVACEFNTLISCAQTTSKKKRCVAQLYTKQVSKNYYSFKENFLDVIVWDMSYMSKVMDTTDTNCKNKVNSKKYIFALGEFHAIQKPYYHGYGKNIYKAWAVDFDKLKFVPVDPKSISCAILHDRD